MGVYALADSSCVTHMAGMSEILRNSRLRGSALVPRLAGIAAGDVAQEEMELRQTSR